MAFVSLQLLLVIGARGSDDDLFRRDDQGALCRARALEELFRSLLISRMSLSACLVYYASSAVSSKDIKKLISG